MDSFKEFLMENDLTERNKAVDIQAIAKSEAESWSKYHDSSPTDSELKQIVQYMMKMKTFSLGKMDDTFGSATVSTGFLKALIAKVKSAIDAAGVGKTGGVSATQTQAQRIDSFLKQKHIGPIRR